jgi:uridine kinase
MTERIAALRRRIPPERAALVAVSGVDGAGKGFVVERLTAELARRGVRAAVAHMDGWLNLPARRFSEEDSARHFYENAVRFEEMFEGLVLPLRANRSIRLEADFTEERASDYRPHVYAFEDVDVILLEGIFLLQPRFLPLYDLSIWVDCTLETALERAVSRSQEGLSPEETVRAYRSIYFPAQEIHRQRDRPEAAADLVFANDPRLETSASGPASKPRWARRDARRS